MNDELLTHPERSKSSDWDNQLHPVFQLPYDVNFDVLNELLLTLESSSISSSSLSSDNFFIPQQSDRVISGMSIQIYIWFDGFCEMMHELNLLYGCNEIDFLLTMIEEDEEEAGGKKEEVISHASSCPSLCNDNEEERRKRRRIYRRNHYHRTHPFSRIPRMDIRRQFPTLWMNMFHRCDPPLYASFIRHFGHKDLVIGVTGWSPGKDGYITTYLPHISTEYKTEKYLESYLHRCAMSVDMTYELYGCEIRRSRVSKGTEVALNLRNVHTTLYDLDLPVDRRIKANDVCDLLPYRKFSSKPMKIVTECIISFHFDDDVSSVDRVCFHLKSYTCYPIDSIDIKQL